jgi:hypothetical protein
MGECLPLWRVLLAEYEHVYGEVPAPKPANLDQVVALLHKKDRAALCISGGGIRSASFALGVIQALARLGTTAKDSFLAKIDYLSTVSGGGYIGSWLSGWAQRRGGLEPVIEELRQDTPPKDKLKPEPAPVHHLREYSNYLTPKLGLLSADTWAFFGAYFRNLLLMWAVLIPLFVGFLALPRVFVSFALSDSTVYGTAIKWAAYILFGWALFFVGLTRPTAKPTSKTWFYDDGAFQILCLIPLCLFAVTVAIGHAWFDLVDFGLPKMMLAAAVFTIFSSLVYTIRKIKDEGAAVVGQQLKELLVAAISGALLGLLVYVFLKGFQHPIPHMKPADPMSWLNGHVPMLNSSIASAYVVFAVPLVILALLLQATIFIGGTGRFNDDFDREWWGRAAAWVIIAGISWIVITAVVIYGPIGIYYAPRTISAVGGVTGLFALLAGGSSKTSANKKQKDKESTGGTISNLLLGLATPVFALVLLAALSLGTTKLLSMCPEVGIEQRTISSSDIDVLQRTSWKGEKSQPITGGPLGGGNQKLTTIEHPAMEKDKLAGLDHLYVIEKTPTHIAIELFLGAILLAIFASWLIGVNRFSIHALYRDRITRAYLGASNTNRKDNPFTGFDPNDNIFIDELRALPRPLHVVNMCLNLTGGDNLAWQERKAESFTASPLHCGSLNLGYRPSKEYGGPDGMKLGTAVGISGAAASPNQGYHSSPALALLMTFFNVRLGWWLGNPKNDTTYKLANPTSSLRPLLAEAFGMSDAKNPYIYLSDGGHFENLGFYEMVLRRCHHIVISDAGMDDKFIFDDLGMAIRKIYIDFGIRVIIENVRLFPRDPERERGEKKWENPKYCATGRIIYSDVDGPNAPEGRFVYIKPVFYGNEPKDIFNYAMADEKFPHDPTLSDQFFSESQLESYRGLGVYAVQQFTAGKTINTVDELITAAEAYVKK